MQKSIDNWLRDPGLTQTEAAARTNALLEEMERSERVSRRVVSRYDRRRRDAIAAELSLESLHGPCPSGRELSLEAQAAARNRAGDSRADGGRREAAMTNGRVNGSSGPLRVEHLREEAREERPAFVELPTAPAWFSTPTAKRIEAGLMYAQTAGDIAVIHGGAGWARRRRRVGTRRQAERLDRGDDAGHMLVGAVPGARAGSLRVRGQGGRAARLEEALRNAG